MSDKVREFRRLLDEIRWLDADLYDKDLFFTWDRSLKEIQQLLYTAEALKWLSDHHISTRCFESGLALFQVIGEDKFSNNQWNPWIEGNLFAYTSAANRLGLTIHHLKCFDENLRNPWYSFLPAAEMLGIQDIRKMNSTDGAGKEEYQECNHSEKMMDSSLKNNRQNNGGGIIKKTGKINLQNFIDHPIYSLADVLLLKNHFLSLERLAGKKIAMVWNNSMDGNCWPVAFPSTPQGIIALLTRFGMEVTLAHPSGYDLEPSIINIAQKHSKTSGGHFKIVSSSDQILSHMDAVYLINWLPFKNSENLPSSENWESAEQIENYCKEKNIFVIKPFDASIFQSDIISSLIINNRFKEPAKVLATLRKRNTSQSILNNLL